MPKNLLQYDILISCTSEVSTEIGIIKSCIDRFNRSIGSDKGILLNPMHWSTDSYPESGGKPQELLNKQFVLECDLAIGVFWTKFGTPTENYGSGTEEEIEELLKMNKQVFLYFSDVPIQPSQFDQNQYGKVSDFRKKYQGRGIYSTYSKHEEFENNLISHLSQHFLRVSKDSESVVKPENESSALSIIGVVNDEVADKPAAYKSKFLQSKFMEDIRTSAKEMVEEIKGVHIPPEERKEPVRATDPADIKNVHNIMKQFNLSGNISMMENVTIPEVYKSTIINFMDKESLSCNDEFFNVGKLERQKVAIRTPFGEKFQELHGTDDEKIKYRLIVDLYWEIEKLKEFERFFGVLDNKYFLDLALINKGTRFDEDVDVKLFFPKGSLCLPSLLPEPEAEVIEMGMGFFDPIYVSRSPFISDYDDRPEISPFLPGFRSSFESYEEKMQRKLRHYRSKLDSIFCYEVHELDKIDVIAYNTKYIKHGTSKFFPSKIIMNYIPEKITFEISSKYSPNQVKGELEF